MGAACDGADFSGAVVAGMQLQGATLKNAKFAGVNLLLLPVIGFFGTLTLQ